MKTAYWVIPIMVTIAAVVGAALANLNQPPSPQPASSPLAATQPVVQVSPTQASPTQARPTPTSSTVATPSAPPTPSQPRQPLAESPVTIDGIGSVKVGMTIAEASRAAGVSLVSDGESGTPECLYFRPRQPEGISFMVTSGQIARVDIFENSRVKTLSGLGIGSTEAEIRSRFPSQIEVTPHEYVRGGHYLTFVPNDADDRNYRIVFETDPSGRVTQFRSGKLSEVTWVEGCS